MAKRAVGAHPVHGDQERAIVIGGSGGIGSALVRLLRSDGIAVTSVSRARESGFDAAAPAMDLTSEASIEAAARQLSSAAPYCRIIVATGILHERDLAPEKSIRDLDQVKLMRLFAVNAIGPALVAKHFVPLLPRSGHCLFAALSARVGSISDNRLGGWYGYRASKAALNMMIKTVAIELGRTRPDAICVGLHPGTVDTNLSKPFGRSAGRRRIFTPGEAAHHLLNVMDGLTTADSGRCFGWDGAEILP